MWRPQQYLNFPISSPCFTQKCFVKMFQTAVVDCHTKGRFPEKKKKKKKWQQLLCHHRDECWPVIYTLEHMTLWRAWGCGRAGRTGRACDRGRMHVVGARRPAGGRNKMYAVLPRIQWGGRFIKSALLAKLTSHRWDVLRAAVMGGWLQDDNN